LQRNTIHLGAAQEGFALPLQDEISTTPANEDRLRVFYGRPRPGLKYSEAWRGLVQSSDLSDDAKAIIAALPFAIPGRSAEEVFHRLVSIRDLHDSRENLHLREISSRRFWGLSKALDSRTDLEAALFGLAECPYPAQPIHLNVYFAGAFSWMLFCREQDLLRACHARRRSGTPDQKTITSPQYRTGRSASGLIR
jgi:hypothetical protein